MLLSELWMHVMVMDFTDARYDVFLVLCRVLCANVVNVISSEGFLIYRPDTLHVAQ